MVYLKQETTLLYFIATHIHLNGHTGHVVSFGTTTVILILLEDDLWQTRSIETCECRKASSVKTTSNLIF